MISLLSSLLFTAATPLPAVVDEIEDIKEVAAVARPIEFSKVPRKLGKTPLFQSQQPRFGIFLFGLNGETRVWAALDQKNAGGKHYDLLYLDRDADGDLDDEKPIVGAAQPNSRTHGVDFKIGSFAVPGSKDVHQDFQLTAHDHRISFKMKWKGGKITMGLYGPHSDAYGTFTTDPEDAPVFVPGYDRPFTFEHWYSGTLHRGQDTEFKVFVGNRGDRTGTFTCVDDEFLPEGEYPVATLIYQDGDGKERRVHVKLTERC